MNVLGWNSRVIPSGSPVERRRGGRSSERHGWEAEEPQRTLREISKTPWRSRSRSRRSFFTRLEFRRSVVAATTERRGLGAWFFSGYYNLVQLLPSVYVSPKAFWFFLGLEGIMGIRKELIKLASSFIRKDYKSDLRNCKKINDLIIVWQSDHSCLMSP